MGAPSSSEALVEYIVTSLVDHPEQVSVSSYEERGSIVIEVNVADADVGRVIGRGGSVVNNIRALLDVMAAGHGKRVSLEIN